MVASRIGFCWLVVSEMFGDADELGAVPSDGLFGLIGPIEVFLSGEGGYKRGELLPVELKEGGELSAAPLEKREGGDATGFVQLAELVGSECFGTDGLAVGESDLELGGNGVAGSGRLDIGWENDAETHSIKRKFRIEE